MRWELRRVGDLTAGEQDALRTLALTVYPPEVAAVWPGRAIEWAPHQWGVVGWDAEGVAVCYVGVVLRDRSRCQAKWSPYLRWRSGRRQSSPVIVPRQAAAPHRQAIGSASWSMVP